MSMSPSANSILAVLPVENPGATPRHINDIQAIRISQALKNQRWTAERQANGPNSEAKLKAILLKAPLFKFESGSGNEGNFQNLKFCVSDSLEDILVYFPSDNHTDPRSIIPEVPLEVYIERLNLASQSGGPASPNLNFPSSIRVKLSDDCLLGGSIDDENSATLEAGTVFWKGPEASQNFVLYKVEWGGSRILNKEARTTEMFFNLSEEVPYELEVIGENGFPNLVRHFESGRESEILASEPIAVNSKGQVSGFRDQWIRYSPELKAEYPTSKKEWGAKWAKFALSNLSNEEILEDLQKVGKKGYGRNYESLVAHKYLKGLKQYYPERLQELYAEDPSLVKKFPFFKPQQSSTAGQSGTQKNRNIIMSDNRNNPQVGKKNGLPAIPEDEELAPDESTSFFHKFPKLLRDDDDDDDDPELEAAEIAIYLAGGAGVCLGLYGLARVGKKVMQKRSSSCAGEGNGISTVQSAKRVEGPGVVEPALPSSGSSVAQPESNDTVTPESPPLSPETHNIPPIESFLQMPSLTKVPLNSNCIRSNTAADSDSTVLVSMILLVVLIFFFVNATVRAIRRAYFVTSLVEKKTVTADNSKSKERGSEAETSGWSMDFRDVDRI